LKKKTFAFVGVVFTVLLVIVGVWLFKKPSKIKLPSDSEIELIQYNGLIVQGKPTKVSEYEQVWKKSIENAKPLSRFHNMKNKSNAPYYVFSIVEKNDKIVTFKFFKKGNTSYFETESGELYTGIEKIDELVDIEKSSKIYEFRAKSILSDEFYDDLLKYAKNVEFIKYCKKNKFSDCEMYQSSCISLLNNDVKGADADKEATKTVLDINAEYENGKKDNLTASKSDFEKYINDEIKNFKKNSKYKKIDIAFKKAGYSFEEYLRNSKRVFMNYQLEYIKYQYQQEFLKGKIKVKGSYVENINEYSSAKQAELIEKGISKEKEKVVKKDCKEAYKNL
jgi:hypothetical protein